MASIPLPALHTDPITPPANPLQQYAQALGISNEMQNAPIQRQILQQQQQTGAIQVQQQQQAQKDQQAMTSAMQSWDGKNLNDLIPLVVKNGASANAVMGLKSKVLEQQKTLSDIASADATTGSKNLETMKGKNDQIAGALSNVLSLPDEQLGQGVQQAVQGLVQQGLFQPQQAQQAQQLMQLPPDQMRVQLQFMEKGLTSHSQQIADAQKEAETKLAQVNAGKGQAESAYYAKNGGAPGVPAEMMQQSDWLQKHPGSGPSDYKLWVMHNSPMAMVMGNQLGGAQNNQALDFVADNYRKTGQMPPELTRSPGTITAVIQRAAQMDQQQAGGGLASNRADFAANEGSLKNVQKTFDLTHAFEQTAEKNMNLLQQTAQNIPDLGTRFANVPVRMISAKMIGSENMAKFNAALQTAQTESAKVLNNPNSQGVLSDSARHELQGIIDGNMPYGAMVGSLNTLKQDMANRNASYQQQISDIQGRIKTAGQQPNQQQPTDPFAQFGGKAH